MFIKVDKTAYFNSLMARRSGRRSHKDGKSLVDEKAGIASLIDARATRSNKIHNSKSSDDDRHLNELQEQYGIVLKRFKLPAEKVSLDNGTGALVRTVRESQDLDEQSIDNKDEVDQEPDVKEVSKRKLRKLAKPSLSHLKSATVYPQVIEWYDCDAPYPYLLASIKSSKNVVPIPGHWQMKREYLSGRSLMEKRPFELPDIIKQTDIEVMRNTLPDKEADQKDPSLRETSRARVQPKMGSLDIDYKKLHDVFFKLGASWKPDVLLPFGDLYYENRNLYEEAQWKKLMKEKKPGVLSSELREMMRIPEGQLPPWCMKMKNSGLPPGYPNFKVAGLNWGIENMRGEVYGKIEVASGGKSVKPLFGTIISIENEEPEQSVEPDLSSPPVQKSTLPEQDNGGYEKEALKVEPIMATRPKTEGKNQNKDSDTNKTLYTVLEENTIGDAAQRDGTKPVYVLPGSGSQDQKTQENAKPKLDDEEDEEDEKEDESNFRF